MPPLLTEPAVKLIRALQAGPIEDLDALAAELDREPAAVESHIHDLYDAGLVNFAHGDGQDDWRPFVPYKRIELDVTIARKE